LVLGAIDEKTFVCASETCALDAVGAQYVRDILPGEIVYTSDTEEGLKSFLVKTIAKEKSVL
jgi:amidophosphoribosyltransferase